MEYANNVYSANFMMVVSGILICSLVKWFYMMYLKINQWMIAIN